MESLFAVALLVGVVLFFFQSGKRLGSRRGFHAGCRCRRRRFR